VIIRRIAFALDVVQANNFKWVHKKNPEKKNPSKSIKHEQNPPGLWFPESKITGGSVYIVGETLLSTATHLLPLTPHSMKIMPHSPQEKHLKSAAPLESWIAVAVE